MGNDNMGDFEVDLTEYIAANLDFGKTDNITVPPFSRRIDIYQCIHDFTMSRSTKAPDQPSDNAKVCRFLSPEKFLWVIDQKSIRFSSPQQFDDERDCVLHDDISLAIQNCLPNILNHFSACADSWNIDNEWESFRQRRRSDWLISCWTDITDQEDDKLIWYKYAKGRFGAGISAKYGALRDALNVREIELYSRKPELAAGYVNYESQNGRLLPFNKRNGFRSEKEVRFAMQAFEYAGPFDVNLKNNFFELFNLRLSIDSPEHHKAALKNTWIRVGGDRHGITEG